MAYLGSNGKLIIILVPLSGDEFTSKLPPKEKTLSFIPTKPKDFFDFMVVGSNPFPSSSIFIKMCPSKTVNELVTELASAYLVILVNAS